MTELKIPESCAMFSHSLGFLYSHSQVSAIVKKALALLAEKDARISELEALVDHMLDESAGLAESFGLGESAGTFDDVMSYACERIRELESEANKTHGELLKAEARIRELTEWRPMSTAPKYAQSCTAYSRCQVVYRTDADGEFIGWLPLPEVKP